MAAGTDLIHMLEERTLTTWPALQTVFYDGWVIRFAKGHTRRSNSVIPLYGSSIDLHEKIKYCTGLFRARGQRSVFKLTAAAQPAGLDAVLEQAEYAYEAETSVQIADLNGLDFNGVESARITAQPTSDWLDACIRLNAMNPERGTVFTGMLANMVPPAAYASLMAGDEITAAGLGVYTPGYVVVYDIVTHPAYRNQGLARRLMLNLLHWGREQGAQQAFLQVVPENTPAVHLYKRLGFQEVYRYWYRTLD
jgi:ribosomal protein S18 acetylase RimI-like enzyme